MLSIMGQRPLYYILRGTQPVPTNDPREAERLLRHPTRRRVGYAELPDGIVVSTVFLVIDHGWGGTQPILWETMVFQGERAHGQQRYATYSAARRGHKDVVRRLRTLHSWRRQQTVNMLQRVAPGGSLATLEIA